MATALNLGLDASIALTRFGMGARPGELSEAAADPRAYLIAQIRPQGAEQPANPPGEKLLSTAELFSQDSGVRQARRARRRGEEGDNTAVRRSRRMRADAYDVELLARARHGATTKAGFAERWALFWSNHFATARKGKHSFAVVGAFEREAIRPRAFGKFSDLLLAVMHHPTMLLYLDQSKSVGPNSQMGGRRGKGLNENLAREVMELHTLGVDAGYTQNDVTEMARALTGWSIGGDGGPGRFTFREQVHEPGTRKIFGKTYAQQGEAQATAALLDFAASPHTARHLAGKIARHFVSDTPPPSLVAKLEAAFRQSGGRLDQVAKALIAAPEAWTAEAKKIKTPYEFLIAAWRAAGAAPREGSEIDEPLEALGQPVFKPTSPKGWDDSAENWAQAAALMERIKWSSAFAQSHAPQGDPVAHAQAILGPRLSNRSATAIKRAESRNEAFALLLMTPEFQRR